MSYYQNTIKPKDKKPKYKILQKPRLNRSNINSDQISQNSIKNYTLQEDGSKLYTIETCTLTLTENGKVFKQGKFNFEEKENDESEQIKQQELNFKPQDVRGLYINLKFDGQNLQCVTGTAMNLFTMDKSLEQAWDKMVQKFFAQKEIKYEVL